MGERPYKLTAELIDWTAVPPQCNFITQDGNGAVFMHTEEPEAYAHNCTWNGAGGNGSSTKVSRPFNGLFPDWPETLRGTGDGWEAMDSDGGWYWYTFIPQKLTQRWGHSGAGSRLPITGMVDDWQERIWERPFAAVGVML